MEELNEIYDSIDVLNFGQNKNEKFFWIYRLNIEYGKPIRLDHVNLNESVKTKFFEVIESNSKNIRAIGGKSYLITINILDILLEKGIIRTTDFKEIDYEFPQNMIESNNRKLKKSCTKIKY